MGNQTLVPSRSEIQSVESYFLDLKNYIQFRQSMGSTTFMKTAKVNLVEATPPPPSILANQLNTAMALSFDADELPAAVGDQTTPGGGNAPATVAISPSSATTSSAQANAAGNSGQSANNPSPTANNSNINQQQQSAAATSVKQTQQLLYKQRLQALREQQQLVVVKIFPKYDPSVRLDLYSNRVKEIKRTIYGRYGSSGTNCLPFADLVITDRAAFLFRQYVKYNLYDRLSTRPFLANIEKKWLAFQLLCAVNECHSLQIVHGDIKTENVLVNSFLWASLADFASYKPVYLSKNHPSADFNYYFDISRRRTCYIAPERFDHPTTTHEQSNLYDTAQHATALPTDSAEFRPSMDIFSLGCVIAELFMERPLFDFAQLLAYRDHKYSPNAEILAEVADADVSSLILSMISVQAADRRTAHEYLLEQNDRAFPSYFVYLRNYVSRFVGARLNADECVCKLRADLPILLKNFKLNLNEDSDNYSSTRQPMDESFNSTSTTTTTASAATSTVNNDAFFILLSLLLSFVRKVRRAENKLVAVELMATFAKFLDDSVVLDRIVPYYLSLLDERSAAPPIVKAHVIAALHDCLASVQRVDAENLTLFGELVFDTLDTLARDESFLVRATCAKYLAGYALTALRYLDMSFLRQNESGGNGGPKSQLTTDQQQPDNENDPAKLSAYDKEHSQCQYRVMELVMQLMVTDTATASTTVEGNAVRETLMRAQIERLCSFLGRARTTDFLLPHMITMLNEKADWWVRAAFFDALAPVLACIGWESVDIVKSLLEQGLHDAEEFVIHRTLCALARLAELGLLDRAQCVHFLGSHVAPLLCHPSLWIRHGAVGFVTAICGKKSSFANNGSSSGGLNTVDILCSVVPLLGRFLRPSSNGGGVELVHLESAHVLFACLKKPVARAVYDTCAQDGRADQLFVYLTQRSEIRQLNIFNAATLNDNNNDNTGNTSNLPSYIDCTDAGVQELFEHLCSRCDLVEEDEDKLLHMREFLDKQRVAKLTSSLHYTSIINMGGTGGGDSDLLATTTGSFFINNNSTIMAGTTTSAMHLGGYIDIGRQPPQRTQCAQLMARAIQHNTATTKHLSSAVSQDSIDSPVSTIPGGVSGYDQYGSELIEKYLDRAKYVFDEHRHKQYRTVKYRDTVNASLSSNLVCLSSAASKWKPRGYLVLDTREHTREVNRLARNADATYFATCSTSESCVKIWSAEAGVWDARSGFVKSVFTYDRQPQGAATATLTSVNAAAAAASASPTSILSTNALAADGSGSSGGLYRPACISFYNKNSLAILCEDYRFYVIDFNASRTQYRLYSNERLFRSAACKSLLCTCGGGSPSTRNGGVFTSNSSLLDRTTFYYLNKQRGGGSSSTSNVSLCNCSANYPIEMVRIDDTSPSWPFAASANLYDYFSYSQGSRSSSVKGLFCYSTSTGSFSCIDMRSRSTAFDVSRDLRRGYVTSICTDPWYTWMAMGTSTGHVELYDFRFMVPVRTFEHRARASVVRMCAHPMLSSRLCVSYQGNNELAVWNMEQQQQQGPARPELVYWGVQSVPPLCLSQMANSYISGLAACSAFGDEQSTNGLICASTDMKMRYIDLGVDPARDSYVISSAFNLQQSQQQQPVRPNSSAAGAESASAATSTASTASASTFASSITTGGGQSTVCYEMRVIEGTRVLVEIDNTLPASGGGSNKSGSLQQSATTTAHSVAVAAMPALTHQSYFTQHQDAITDLCLCYNPAKSQPVMITSSRDGCLKIWK